MKASIKQTTLSDGSKVWDVDLHPNGKDRITGAPKCIFSCTSEKDMRQFFAGLEKLIEQHTVDTLGEE